MHLDTMDLRGNIISTVIKHLYHIAGCIYIFLSVVMAASLHKIGKDVINEHAVTGLRFDTLHTRILLDNAYTCEPEVYAVIFVHSGPGHRVQRDTIRHTWGSVTKDPQYNTKLLFVVGLPADGSSYDDIHKEGLAHGDMLRLNIVDSYANLTLKSVAMLKWLTERCQGVRYVIKSDDDTFLNTPLLINDLRNVVHDKFMMGDIIAGAQPIRDNKSKYFTPLAEYNGSMYPTYLSGAAYVISGDLIPSLWQAAQTTELFWLEDVYITGLLSRRVHAKHVYNGKFGFRIQTLRPCQLHKVIALHRISPEEMINAWKLLQHEDKNC